MRTVLCWLAVAAALAGCRLKAPTPEIQAPADSVAGTISFELAGPGEAAIMVPVKINGSGPYDFVLDTGATLTCVNQALADSLALPEQAGRFGIGATVSGAGNVRIVGIDSLRIGRTSALDVTACTLDLSSLQQAGLSVDGLLGLNVLKSFRVTLDFSTNTLNLDAL